MFLRLRESKPLRLGLNILTLNFFHVLNLHGDSCLRKYTEERRKDEIFFSLFFEVESCGIWTGKEEYRVKGEAK